MTDPVRLTDPDVWTIRTNPKESPEFKAAMSRLVKRIADRVDEMAAREVYGSVYERTDEHR